MTGDVQQNQNPYESPRTRSVESWRNSGTTIFDGCLIALLICVTLLGGTFVFFVVFWAIVYAIDEMFILDGAALFSLYAIAMLIATTLAIALLYCSFRDIFRRIGGEANDRSVPRSNSNR